MCHHNTFLVYQSMRDATLEKWEKVTHISIAFAWVVAALFGIVGYATFRALSQGFYTTFFYRLSVFCFAEITIFFLSSLFSVYIYISYFIRFLCHSNKPKRTIKAFKMFSYLMSWMFANEIRWNHKNHIKLIIRSRDSISAMTFALLLFTFNWVSCTFWFRGSAWKLLSKWWFDEFRAYIVFRVNSVDIPNWMFRFTRGKSN